MRSRAGSLAAVVLALSTWAGGSGLTVAEPAGGIPAAYEDFGWEGNWRPNYGYGDGQPRWRYRHYGYAPRYQQRDGERWRRPYRYGERSDRGHRAPNWRPHRDDRYGGYRWQDDWRQRDYGGRYQAPLAYRPYYSPRTPGWWEPRWGWREL